MIAVSPLTVPVSKESTERRVVPGWWEAKVYGCWCVRWCPLVALAVACEMAMEELTRKDTP